MTLLARSLSSLGLAVLVASGCSGEVGDDSSDRPLEDSGADVYGDDRVEPADTEPSADTASVDAAPVDAAPPPSTCPRVRVAVPAGSILNVRATPSTTAAIVTKLPNNAVVPVLDRVVGEAVSGNTEWMKVDVSPTDGFVSAVFAKCTTDPAPTLTPPSAWHLPLACGTTARVSQGNDGTVSHQGKAFYAYDFAIPVNTPLVAMADGIVTYLYGETGPGDPCYDGGPSSCFPYANYVVLRHGDGTGSIYKHLNKVLVSLGEFVPSGKAVGLSGSTGYSTGPHAHVMRQDDCGAATSCQSLKVAFADVPGTGIPVTGQTVTSKNGCK